MAGLSQSERSTSFCPEIVSMIPTILEMYDLSLASHRSTGSLGELMLGLGEINPLRIPVAAPSGHDPMYWPIPC